MSSGLQTAFYIASAVLFILALGGLSHPETSRRGNIYDRSARSLATSVRRSSIFADPSGIEDPKAAALLLSGVLHLERGPLARKLTRPRQFAWD